MKVILPDNSEQIGGSRHVGDNLFVQNLILDIGNRHVVGLNVECIWYMEKTNECELK